MALDKLTYHRTQASKEPQVIEFKNGIGFRLF